jgi:hypothetical protein
VTHLGQSPMMSSSLIYKAASLAAPAAAQSLTEAQIIIAALDADALTNLCRELRLDHEALKSALSEALTIPPPDAGLLVYLNDDPPSIWRKPSADRLEGRASVLACAAQAHPLDTVDVFVAALFDPQSVTSNAVIEDLGRNRDDLLRNIAAQTNRYTRIEFPSTG